MSRAAPSSLCCWRREGHAAWVCSSERSLSSLWVAWILHAIFTGGRGGSARRAPQPAGSRHFVFHFLCCLFENTAAQFCCILAAVEADAPKTGQRRFKAIRRCQNTSRCCLKDLKEEKRECHSIAARPSMFRLMETKPDVSKLLQCDANTHLTFLLWRSEHLDFAPHTPFKLHKTAVM